MDEYRSSHHRTAGHLLLLSHVAFQITSVARPEDYRTGERDDSQPYKGKLMGELKWELKWKLKRKLKTYGLGR